MTNSERENLIKAGEALYGERWKTDLGRALGLGDGRRIRQWLAGDRPIPEGVWKDVKGLLRDRELLIADVIQRLPSGDGER